MEESEGQFECLGENTVKYINFSVTIQKELAKGKKVTKDIYSSCKVCGELIINSC